MSIKLIEHRDLSEKELNEIAALKEQHWPYGIDSQKYWICNQFLGDDCHVMLYKDRFLNAYVGLNKLEIEIENDRINMTGIGNVCVAKTTQGTGLGSEIMRAVNDLLILHHEEGILLCHQPLQSFYKKLGWKRVDYDDAYIANSPFNEYIMTYNSNRSRIHRLNINKNF